MVSNPEIQMRTAVAKAVVVNTDQHSGLCV